MPIFDSKQVQEINKLRLEGKFKKIIEIMTRIEKLNSLSDSERIDLKLQKSQIFLDMGNFSDTRNIVASIINQMEKKASPLQILDAFLIKLEVKILFGRVKECSELVNLIEDNLSKLKDIERKRLLKRKGRLYIGKSYVNSAKGNFEDSLESANKSLALHKELKDRAAIADSYLRLGWTFDNNGNMNKAFKNYQQCLDIRKKLRDRPKIGQVLNFKGRMHIVIDENYQKALKYCKEALKIQNKVGNKLQIISTLENLGWIHRLQGDMQEALEYYQQILSFAVEIDHKGNIFYSRFQIGLIYGLQGELDLALEYVNTALTEQLTYFEEQGISRGYGLAWQYNRLGKLYRDKGDYSKTKKCFRECLTICRQETTDSHKLVESEALYYLVSIALEEDDPDNAQKNIKLLKNISDVKNVLNRPLINQRFRVAQALLMKSSQRLKDKIGAQNILVKFIKEECSDHDLVVNASIILCELLLDELRLSSNQEVLQEVKELMNHLLSIAKTQPSFWLLAEVYVFQSRLSLLDLDLKSAEILLDQGLLLAEEKGLKKLAVKIFSEKSLFEKQTKQWEHLIARNAPLNEMLNLIHLDSLLERMANKKLESSEEETLNYAQRAKQIAQIWNGD
ncbi:MAG: tetratricopeptide repeat protein [Candidatus Hodarchaeales archaeon]